MATNKMPTGHASSPLTICLDLEGIDLTDIKSASTILIGRLEATLRSMNMNGDNGAEFQAPPGTKARMPINIDITDVDLDAEFVLPFLIERLGIALLHMAKEKAMALEKSSLPHMEVGDPSPDHEECDSVGSPSTLGPVSGPQHFLSSWEDDLEAFENDSDIYERSSDTSTVTKSPQDSKQKQKQPAQGYGLRGDVLEETTRQASEKLRVVLAKIERVPLSLQGERKWYFVEDDCPKIRRSKPGVSVSRMPM